jgi:hypothetical protein
LFLILQKDSEPSTYWLTPGWERNKTCWNLKLI